MMIGLLEQADIFKLYITLTIRTEILSSYIQHASIIILCYSIVTVCFNNAACMQTEIQHEGLIIVL